MSGATPLLFVAAKLTGWALVHSLWQGVLLGVLYALARRGLPRGNARYCLGLITLAALVLCQAVTVGNLLRAPPSVIDGAFAVRPIHAMDGASPDPFLPAIGGFDAVLPWISALWLIGVLALSLRAWIQWRGLKKLVLTGEPASEWQQQLADMASSFKLRARVRLLCSKAVASPVLVGLMRPVILLPLAVACQFPVAQVRLILAHELAHVRRLDPLANLFQLVLETLYFHHPVVHWISREVRNEREVCCDALALSLSGGDRREYIEALAALGELHQRQLPLVLASNGGVLLDRVRIIAAPKRSIAQSLSASMVVAAMLAIALMLVTLTHEKRLAWQHDLPDAIQQTWQAPRLRAQELAPWPSLRPGDLSMRLVDVARPRALDDADEIPPIPDVSLHPVAKIAGLPAIVSRTARIAEMSLVRAVDSVASSEPTISGITPVQIQRPVYPQRAFEQGVEGSVLIEFGLDAGGHVLDTRVVGSTPPGVFDRAAIRALHGWRFTSPVGAQRQQRYRQTLTFELHGVQQGARSAEEIPARLPCKVVTGTHICRQLDEPRFGNVGP